MASRCIRSMTRTSLSSIKSQISRSQATAAASRSSFFAKGPASASPSPSPRRRFTSISRSPVELGSTAGGSMYPLHSAVAAARLTSRLSTAARSCRDLSQGVSKEFGYGYGDGFRSIQAHESASP